jgi:hypothetical protein
LSTTSLEIIRHAGLLAIHQDLDYPPARCYIGCRYGDKETLANGTWSSYSVLATNNVMNLDVTTTSSTTVAIVMNWANTTNTVNMTFFLHEIGIVPFPNSQITVKDIWTGQVIKTIQVLDHHCVTDATLSKSSKTKETSHHIRGSSMNAETDESFSSKDTMVQVQLAYEPIAMEVPTLGPHDNVVYQFESRQNPDMSSSFNCRTSLMLPK